MSLSKNFCFHRMTCKTTGFDWSSYFFYWAKKFPCYFSRLQMATYYSKFFVNIFTKASTDVCFIVALTNRCWSAYIIIVGIPNTAISWKYFSFDLKLKNSRCFGKMKWRKNKLKNQKIWYIQDKTIQELFSKNHDTNIW